MMRIPMRYGRVGVSLMLGGALALAGLSAPAAQAAGIGVTGVRLTEQRVGPTLTLTATATLFGHLVT